MKKLYILLLFMICAGYAQQQPFITTWQILDFNLDITVPAYGTNYTIDFDDGTVLNNQSDPVNHIYSQAGIYTISITGNTSVRFGGDHENADRLKTIEQWGNTPWTTM